MKLWGRVRACFYARHCQNDGRDIDRAVLSRCNNSVASRKHSAHKFCTVVNHPEQAMDDQTLASIARNLATALMTRAKTRMDADQKQILALQSELCAAVMAEQNECKNKSVTETISE